MFPQHEGRRVLEEDEKDTLSLMFLTSIPFLLPSPSGKVGDEEGCGGEGAGRGGGRPSASLPLFTSPSIPPSVHARAGGGAGWRLPPPGPPRRPLHGDGGHEAAASDDGWIVSAAHDTQR